MKKINFKGIYTGKRGGQNYGQNKKYVLFLDSYDWILITLSWCWFLRCRLYSINQKTDNSVISFFGLSTGLLLLINTQNFIWVEIVFA